MVLGGEAGSTARGGWAYKARAQSALAHLPPGEWLVRGLRLPFVQSYSPGVEEKSVQAEKGRGWVTHSRGRRGLGRGPERL